MSMQLSNVQTPTEYKTNAEFCVIFDCMHVAWLRFSKTFNGDFRSCLPLEKFKKSIVA